MLPAGKTTTILHCLVAPPQHIQFSYLLRQLNITAIVPSAMMVSSPHGALILAAIMTVGCIASLFVPICLPQIIHESSPRQLQVHSSHNDPRTIQLRPNSAASEWLHASQSNANASTAWWKDINYDQTWQCGKFKCYFPSVSDPTNGYLV